MENTFETNKHHKVYTVLISLIIAAFIGGFFLGRNPVQINNGQISIDRGQQPANSADYSLLWETLEELNEKFVDRPLDQQKLLYGAVTGMVNAAGDPYTVFFDPEHAKLFAEQLSGSFEGIGIEIGIRDEQLNVVAPLDNTPAQKAGLLAGDLILEINGESTLGMSTEQAVIRIRGKAGTQVELTVLHKGKTETEKVTITRAKIEIKSVTLENRQVDNKKIAVVKVNQFGDDTQRLFDGIVDQIVTGNYSGMVLDLRNNPGGYLPTAVEMISNWIPEGEVALKEVDHQKKEKLYRTDGRARLQGIKTVVLVNQGSASASEIVSGALQDYKVATLVGTKTYGKGSVQELVPLKQDAELKVTIAKWYTPQGRGIDKTGLEPDIVVEITDEDVEAKLDPQLDKALELLK